MAEHPIVVDLDDFTGSMSDIGRLDDMKAEIPDFKATLFTIPGLVTRERLQRIRFAYPWIDLVPHGWMHPTSRECEKWTHAEMRACLAACDNLGLVDGFTRGWKAPGWLLSDSCYDVLLEQGYWLADQIRNRDRRPSGLKVYELDRREKIHGHLGHRGGHNDNELEYLVPSLLKLKNAQFGFVRDFVK
jgi:peptidoglycan/xylan/chitin deacetylase (PgdA/CDA1 family)